MKLKPIFIFLLLSTMGLKESHSYVLSPKEIKAKEKAIRTKIVQTARSLLGYKGSDIRVKNKSFRYDCSSFVMACYYNAGLDLNKIILARHRSKNMALSLYKSINKTSWKNPQKLPKPGDLIFFDNTYDRNRNKRWDDAITHIGLVEKVHRDGRVYWIHLVRKGIVRYVTHLGRPHVYVQGNIKLNDFLRRRPASDKRKERYLSGYLFSSFANPIFLFKRGKVNYQRRDKNR